MDPARREGGARGIHRDELPNSLVWWHRRRILDALDGIGGGVAWSQDVESMLDQETEFRELSGHHPASWTIHPGPERERLEVGGK